MDGPRPDAEGDIVDGDEAVEFLGQPIRLQDDPHPPRTPPFLLSGR